MNTTVKASRLIAADAGRLYALVSDLPRMGEWSPENLGGRWKHGSTTAAVGAVFKGRNRKGLVFWTSMSKITIAEPGTKLQWLVSFGPLKHLVRWTYTFDPQPAGGTIVTEQHDDLRPDWWAKIGGFVGRIPDSDAHYLAGIETTLAKLAASAE